MRRPPVVFFCVCFVTALALGASPAALLGQGGLDVIVRDAASGTGLPRAQISLPGLGYGGITDVEGHFHIANLPAGAVEVEVRLLGYGIERREGRDRRRRGRDDRGAARADGHLGGGTRGGRQPLAPADGDGIHGPDRRHRPVGADGPGGHRHRRSPEDDDPLLQHQPSGDRGRGEDHPAGQPQGAGARPHARAREREAASPRGGHPRGSATASPMARRAPTCPVSPRSRSGRSKSCATGLRRSTAPTPSPA